MVIPKTSLMTAGLQNMMDRRGIKDCATNSIEKLAELMQTESHRQRVMDGRLTALNNRAFYFEIR